MDIIVIGMGEVGRYTTSVLAAEGNNVTIVDIDPKAISDVEESMDVLAYRGHGASMRTLQAVRASQADLLIASSSVDESNILACMLAKKLGTRKVIGRVSSREHLPNDQGVYYNLFDIDLVISPEILTAIEIVKQVRSVGTVMVENFADNRIELVQLAIDQDTKLINQPLADISARYLFGKGMGVAAILRQGALLIPSGADAMQPGDEVLVIGRADGMDELDRVFGRGRRRVARRIMLIGGGEIGFTVAKSFEGKGVEVTLIERAAERAAELADLLQDTTVLTGDGTNLSLLEEEGVGNVDVFIAVSPDDETNLMAGLLAKRLGCKKVVALVHRPDYGPIYEQLGIDAAISPRLLAARQILKYVREGEVASVSVIADGRGEILELVASEGSLIVNRPLLEVNWPRGAMVGAVASTEGIVVPFKGRDTIQPGQTAIVFTTAEARPAVERMFRKSSFLD
jgi:trk system potassium uptake protein